MYTRQAPTNAPANWARIYPVYALNPARDIGPRIAHGLLPIKGKGSSNWGYAIVPFLGPLLGAMAAVLLYGAIPW